MPVITGSFSHTTAFLGGEIELDIEYTVRGDHRPATRLTPEEFPDVEIIAAWVYGKKDKTTGKTPKIDMLDLLSSDKDWDYLYDELNAYLQDSAQDAAEDAAEARFEEQLIKALEEAGL